LRYTVQVLLDIGSSDNFIRPCLVKFLGLTVESALYFKVVVGIGHFLTCEGKTRQIPLQIQEHTINVYTFLLPVADAEVILGASWLAKLGPHAVDYSDLTIKLYDGPNFITLCGEPRAVV